jgi:O-antigen/teichoic acid export membrane protein
MNGTIARNAIYLGLGQVGSTILAFALNAALGRFLGASDFGVYYSILTISSFVGFALDWGHSVYVTREVARGRTQEGRFLGSALLTGVVGVLAATILAALIALGFRNDGRIAYLAPLAVFISVPAILYGRFGAVFRGKERMELDVAINLLAKAATVAATLGVLLLGGGIAEVILAQLAGGLISLALGIAMAARAGVQTQAPDLNTVRELFWAGVPIVAATCIAGAQPFVEVLLLSAFASPTVVGWYGAARTILGIVFSPANILAGASFSAMSRNAESRPEFGRIFDATAKVLLLAAAFASAALFVFSDHIISILYGRGNFERSAEILRVAAIFLPVFFFASLLAMAAVAMGKNKQCAVLSWAGLLVCAACNWFLISICQSRFGNGAIALVATSGIVEVFMMAGYIWLLPKGLIGKATVMNIMRAAVVAVCTVLFFTRLQGLPLWQLAPLFGVIFSVAAFATKLMSLSDLKKLPIKRPW